jgi:hypothetical protein
LDLSFPFSTETTSACAAELCFKSCNSIALGTRTILQFSIFLCSCNTFLYHQLKCFNLLFPVFLSSQAVCFCQLCFYLPVIVVAYKDMCGNISQYQFTVVHFCTVSQ